VFQTGKDPPDCLLIKAHGALLVQAGLRGFACWAFCYRRFCRKAVGHFSEPAQAMPSCPRPAKLSNANSANIASIGNLLFQASCLPLAVAS
jgi:hypothetical protein